MIVAFTGRAVLTAALTLTLGGCVASLAPRDADDRVRDLVAARARWNQHGLSSYVMDVQLLCFCPVEGVATVTVTAGRVTSAVVKASGRPVSPQMLSAYRSVEGLFDQLEDAIGRNAHRIDAEYDSALGYPRQFFIDYSVNVADEESGIQVHAFTTDGR